tara:strand:- start:1634 stop:1882 length:249 start_codon:yes stop_codon:yes gene_type:complete
MTTTKKAATPRYTYSGHVKYGPIAFPVRLDGGGSRFYEVGEEMGLPPESYARATFDGFEFDPVAPKTKTPKRRKPADTEGTP